MKKNLFAVFLTICLLGKSELMGQSPQLIKVSEKDINYDKKKQSLLPKVDNIPVTEKKNIPIALPSCFEAFDNTGGNGWTEVPRNDDDSYGPISLGWNFSLFGTIYNSVYINTNGNITFDYPLSQYTPDGFPISTPMVATFWGDVDTRNPSSGSIWFKLFPDRLVITWDNVGYYNTKIDKRNTFQMTIKANTANNFTGNDVIFAYDDMQWTTGDVSGGSGGLGGSPATVGANRGNDIDFIQTGRFNLSGSTPPNITPGSYGGIDWLDGKCLGYQVKGAGGNVNIPPSVAGLPTNNQFILNNGDTRNLVLQFSGPEVNQNVNITTSLNGLCNTTATITNNNTSNPSLLLSTIGNSCNLGTHTISITATDNGTPISSQTFNINIIVNPCQGNVQLINVTDDISAGTNIIKATTTNGKIIASNRVLNANTRATYIAKSVTLNNGFRADFGTIFKAEIGGCN